LYSGCRNYFSSLEHVKDSVVCFVTLAQLQPSCSLHLIGPHFSRSCCATAPTIYGLIPMLQPNSPDPTPALSSASWDATLTPATPGYGTQALMAFSIGLTSVAAHVCARPAALL